MAQTMLHFIQGKYSDFMFPAPFDLKKKYFRSYNYVCFSFSLFLKK